MHGSEKKLNRALTRSNSRALRAAPAHKDKVFCVYCWGPATKKCDHLASCREHSCLYLRSQVNINAKWWLRPSDFACHMCPTTGVMRRKAQEWNKDLSQAPREGFFDERWDEWRSMIESQIYRLKPGAFPTWAARCEYVSWMNGLEENEMLFIRYLSYIGFYAVTLVYAETGTMPNTVRYGMPTREEPPPTYPNATRAPLQPIEENETLEVAPSPMAAPIMRHAAPPVKSPVVPPVPLVRSSTLLPAMRSRDLRRGSDAQALISLPRQSQIQTLCNNEHNNQLVLSRPATHRSAYAGSVAQIAQPSHEDLLQLGQAMTRLSMTNNAIPPMDPHTLARLSQISQGHAAQSSSALPQPPPVPSQMPAIAPMPPVTPFPMQVPLPGTSMGVPYFPPGSPVVVPPIPPTTSHRVSFAPPLPPLVPSDASLQVHPPQSSHWSNSTTNPTMARYMDHLRTQRVPIRPATAGSLPGAWPQGHPVDDDDWETISTYSMNPSVPPTPVPRPVSFQSVGGGAYPGWNAGGVRRVDHPLTPFLPM